MDDISDTPDLKKHDQIISYLPYIALFLIAFTFALTTYLLVSSFKALPCPIFGGDICYQQSVVEHILAGGNPLKSSSIQNAMPGYLPLYAFLVAVFSIIFGLKAFQGMLFFSVILAFFIPILWAFLFRNFIENDWLAVIGAVFVILAFDNILLMPVLKYTDFTILIMLPLFLISLYRAYSDFNWKNIALLAFFYSILTISHLVVFIGATLILGVFSAYRLYSLRNTDVLKNIQAIIHKNWVLFVVFCTIAVPILLLYWYEPIFVYHLKFAYDRTHIDTPDVTTFGTQVWFLGTAIQETLISFTDVSTGIRSLFFIFTILLFIKSIRASNKIESQQLQFLTALFFASILATFSYFVTEPLFHINFIPSYLLRITLLPSLTLLGLCLIDKMVITGLTSTQNDLPNASSPFTAYDIASAGAILFLILIIYSKANAVHNSDEVFNYAHGILGVRSSLSDYIKANTSVNDVFLSSKEMSFMITSLTGRKLVTNRWVHQNDPYTDMPRRDLDAAIMLYGNNMSKRIELLKKYEVKYLYWDAKWGYYEYQNASATKINIIDPLATFDTQDARNELDSNRINYTAMVYWVDPAVRADNIRKFPLLMISSENYRSLEEPWEPQLNPYLELVWSYKENGQIIAALYEVNYT